MFQLFKTVSNNVGMAMEKFRMDTVKFRKTLEAFHDFSQKYSMNSQKMLIVLELTVIRPCVTKFFKVFWLIFHYDRPCWESSYCKWVGYWLWRFCLQMVFALKHVLLSIMAFPDFWNYPTMHCKAHLLLHVWLQIESSDYLCLQIM